MLPRRTLMVMRMNDTSSTEEIAEIFTRHDETSLPVELGATRRVLFRHKDLYLHLIESDGELMPGLYKARSHPVFQETNDRLSHLLSRYDADWTELNDSRAEVFYDWTPDS
jgi:cyclase